MLLQWVDLDGITQTDSRLSIENAATYAKRNCRNCHSRGIEHWDNGWEYYFRSRKPINPRVYACECVLRRIDKLGGIQ